MLPGSSPLPNPELDGPQPHGLEAQNPKSPANCLIFNRKVSRSHRPIPRSGNHTKWGGLSGRKLPLSVIWNLLPLVMAPAPFRQSVAEMHRTIDGPGNDLETREVRGLCVALCVALLDQFDDVLLLASIERHVEAQFIWFKINQQIICN